MKEIERKFILNRMPDVLVESSVRIRQGYITLPVDSVELRLRQKGDTCLLTVKQGRGMVREEQELEISPRRFEQLWPMTQGRQIRKTRRRVRISEDCLVEIDIFADALSGLRLCEVEFANEADALTFEPPDWFGTEVTHDEAYKNQCLAVRGIPA